MWESLSFLKKVYQVRANNAVRVHSINLEINPLN